MPDHRPCGLNLEQLAGGIAMADAAALNLRPPIRRSKLQPSRRLTRRGSQPSQCAQGLKVTNPAARTLRSTAGVQSGQPTATTPLKSASTVMSGHAGKPTIVSIMSSLVHAELSE
jgi:hypothetical protein